MNVFSKTWRRICRRVYPQLYIRMEIERLEHGQGMLRLGARAMSAQMRQMQEERVFDELSELYEWQWEFGDKALLKRAAKIGIHLAEITFVDELAENNIGRYHQIGTFGNHLLRDPFREALVKAIVEREPIYEKQRNERRDFYVKLATAFIGIIGAATGLVAVFRR